MMTCSGQREDLETAWTEPEAHLEHNLLTCRHLIVLVSFRAAGISSPGILSCWWFGEREMLEVALRGIVREAEVRNWSM